MIFLNQKNNDLIQKTMEKKCKKMQKNTRECKKIWK